MPKKPVPKLEETPETCASCRFFLLDDPKDEAGLCRLEPAKYVGDEESGGWTQAVMTYDGWCSKHERVKQ
jgi:hypothetical protein